MSRIYLSPPDVGAAERQLILEAFDSNWIAPVGPHVDAFEEEFAEIIGVKHAVALSSGTAALHLALLLLGIGPGDEVFVPTLTFVATANAVAYTGATPVFIDSEWSSWNIDPLLVSQELEIRAQDGRLPKAIIAVDLYGQCADYGTLRPLCDQYGIPLLEDAAEALGATHNGASAGTAGDISIFSFNGNKIVTTSSGGMLVTDTDSWAQQARHLAKQAREPVLHYEHSSIGFNYGMSNILAALGRGQLRGLTDKVLRRREIFDAYVGSLGQTPGLEFMPEAAYGSSTRWLTVALVDPERFGATREEIISALAADDIEARPTWKPMHRQPAYAGTQIIGGSVADAIFDRGVCLPSGSSMSDSDIKRVVQHVRAVVDRPQTHTP